MAPLRTTPPQSNLPARTICYSMVDIGQLLRVRRKELRMTQTQAAEYCLCSQRLISEMERGRGSVGIDKVMRYANGLGVDFVMSVRGRQ